LQVQFDLELVLVAMIMTDDRLRMQDPREQYPKPPFPKQSQPPPSLATKMDPKPDHGESSYRGAHRLEGRRALVTGADSGIGRAAAIAFAREGADVVISYLPSEEGDAYEVLELILAEGRKGIGIPGDIKQEDFCQHLVEEAVKRLGGLDILVNNAGKQATQPFVSEITSDQFDQNTEDKSLRSILDHQGRTRSFEAGLRNHQYCLRPGFRAVGSASGLCDN
jgi:hypothetical protein